MAENLGWLAIGVFLGVCLVAMALVVLAEMTGPPDLGEPHGPV